MPGLELQGRRSNRKILLRLSIIILINSSVSRTQTGESEVSFLSGDVLMFSLERKSVMDRAESGRSAAKA